MATGVLCIHGFSGGPYEVEPFANFLKEQTNWDVRIAKLSGHGLPEELNMKGSSSYDWIRDAEVAFRSLARDVDEVIVVGFSMGGLLAIHLANKYPVAKLVLLSAALNYVSLKQLTEDIVGMVGDLKQGTLKQNELYERYMFKLKHVPFLSTVEFMKVAKLAKKELESVQCPTYIVQGRCDGIVPVKTAQLLFNNLKMTEKCMYISEKGKHFICYSEDCDIWFNQVLRFLKDLKF